MLFSINCYKSLVKDILYSNLPFKKKLSACEDLFKTKTVNKYNTPPSLSIISKDLIVSFASFT